MRYMRKNLRTATEIKVVQLNLYCFCTFLAYISVMEIFLRYTCNKLLLHCFLRCLRCSEA